MLIALMLAAGVSLMPHLRPLDSLAEDAIEIGLQLSPTFAALAQSIEDAEFVVYVESSRILKRGMDGCLVHGAAGPRYLRVLLKTGLSLDERIAVLAHELQHVREVIQAGILNDPTAMQALFSRIGFNKRQQGARQQEYETEAARQVALTVARELRATPSGGDRERWRAVR
jgi:hypothetical protein